VVELNGVRKTVSLGLVPDTRPGDYVIVHVGYAIGKIDPAEAERTLQMFAEIDGITEPASGAGSAGLESSRQPNPA